MNFLNGSIRVGRLFDINIRVHILFLFYIGYRLFSAISDGEGWQFHLAFLALLFGLVLIHEFGHCFGARLVGGEARDILMWPLGGLAYARAPMRPWPQFVTVAAGPLVNVIFCILSAAVLLLAAPESVRLSFGWGEGSGIRLVGPMERWMLYTAVFYQVNFFLLSFNLLPIYPLDGGQLLHAILWPFFGLQRATIIAASIGLLGCAYFVLQGLQPGGGGMLFFIALFGGMTCWQQLQAARQGLMVEDSRFESGYGPRQDPRPWWQRMLHLKRRPTRTTGGSAQAANPNPGGWVAKVEEQADTEAELDRILKKVHESGLQSLSYVERQRLERITREHQERERQFQRDRRG